jgi:hypothetical protein
MEEIGLYLAKPTLIFKLYQNRDYIQLNENWIIFG